MASPFLPHERQPSHSADTADGGVPTQRRESQGCSSLPTHCTPQTWYLDNVRPLSPTDTSSDTYLPAVPSWASHSTALILRFLNRNSGVMTAPSPEGSRRSVSSERRARHRKHAGKMQQLPPLTQNLAREISKNMFYWIFCLSYRSNICSLKRAKQQQRAEEKAKSPFSPSLQPHYH